MISFGIRGWEKLHGLSVKFVFNSILNLSLLSKRAIKFSVSISRGSISQNVLFDVIGTTTLICWKYLR